MKKPNRKELFEIGLIRKGQKCQIIGRPETASSILSDKYVKYNGVEMTYNAWLKSVTGWSAVSFFDYCEIVGDDTAENIRHRHLGTQPKPKRKYTRRS